MDKVDLVRPVADCPLCEAVWELLDQAFTMRPPDVMPEGAAEHFLAGVCVWWVAQSLAQFGGKEGPLFQCLTNTFAEHGIQVTAMADTRPGTRPS